MNSRRTFSVAFAQRMCRMPNELVRDNGPLTENNHVLEPQLSKEFNGYTEDNKSIHSQLAQRKILEHTHSSQ